MGLSDSSTANYHQRHSGRGSLSKLGTLLACLLALVVALAACTTAPGTTASVEVPAAAASSSAPSPSKPAPDAAPAMQECTTDVAEAAFDVVQRQQRAFADDDFAAALRLASTGFRSSVTLPQFTALIVSGYNFLLVTPTLRLTECRTQGTAAVLRVGVGSNFVLAYRMVVEDGQWRIDGASILKEISA